ncbi:MAG: hypothetical protein LBI13_02770 [Streptococcaceae bacterium]|jgi:MFS family permease|nr:hypothetical protein [Streptococcaceae bacterium]
MSVNKILGLIGSIFASVLAPFVGMGFIVAGIKATTEGTANSFVGALFALYGLIMIAALVFAWIAWSKLDKANEEPWKIYFLVLGIVSIIGTMFVGTVPGVLFILTFAIRTKKTQAQVEGGKLNASEVATAWSEVRTSEQAVTSMSSSSINEDAWTEVSTASEVVEEAPAPASAASTDAFGWTEVSSEKGE